jgi:hypothetical protein
MRKNFLFYRSWYELLKQLPEEVRNEIYGYIVEYGLCGTEPCKLREEIKPVWSLIKSQMDTHRRNYDLACKGKSSTNSCKNLDNGPDTSNAEKEREKESNKEKEKEDREDKDKEDKEEEKKKLNPTDLSKKAALSLPKVNDFEKLKMQEEMQKRMDDFYQTLVPYVRIYGKQMIRAFYDYWTEPNHTGTKMRFELQRTWSLERRLKIWENNSLKFGTKKTVNDDDEKIIYV